MTTLPKAIVIVTLVISLGIAVYEAHRASTLESQLQLLQAQNASLAAQTQQQESKRDDTEHRAETPEAVGKASNAADSELLRLRGEVGLLRRQIAAGDAKAQPATNQMPFTQPYLPRAAWSDHGTDKPLNTMLTMFWALRQRDESKLGQILLPLRDSQTLDDLTFPKDEWEKFSAIQVATVTVTAGTAAHETATVQIIAEKSLGVGGADKGVDIYRWVLTKENDQWLIRTRL